MLARKRWRVKVRNLKERWPKALESQVPESETYWEVELCKTAFSRNVFRVGVLRFPTRRFAFSGAPVRFPTRVFRLGRWPKVWTHQPPRRQARAIEKRDLDKPLSDSDAKEFRRLAGIYTALYLSPDCPTIQFAMTGIAAGMAKPTVLHQLRLKRLGRYLVRYPVEGIFEMQDQPDELQVYTDSDWAACVETRKSMSSYSIKYGKHSLDTSCVKQRI